MRKLTFILAAVLFTLSVTGCSAGSVSGGSVDLQAERASQGSSQPAAAREQLDPEDVSTHPLFSHFQAVYDAPELVTGIAGDCNGDGVEDLTVVFRHGEGNHLVTVYFGEEGFRLSEETSAPVEDCLLTWRDIDEVPPVELLVSGRIGIHIGYAIYRFEAGAWTALFGDGMGDCC